MENKKVPDFAWLLDFVAFMGYDVSFINIVFSEVVCGRNTFIPHPEITRVYIYYDIFKPGFGEGHLNTRSSYNDYNIHT